MAAEAAAWVRRTRLQLPEREVSVVRPRPETVHAWRWVLSRRARHASWCSVRGSSYFLGVVRWMNALCGQAGVLAAPRSFCSCAGPA